MKNLIPPDSFKRESTAAVRLLLYFPLPFLSLLSKQNSSVKNYSEFHYHLDMKNYGVRFFLLLAVKIYLFCVIVYVFDTCSSTIFILI